MSLIFILLISFVAQMLESASIQNAKNYRRADVERAVECLFAEYQKNLLEEYDIFALEGSYETETFDEERIKERLNFYGGSQTDHEIQRLQLLTDYGGRAFREQVAAYMENKYGLDLVKHTVAETDVWKSQSEKSENYGHEREIKQEELDGMLAEQGTNLPEEDNPIAHMNSLKSTPILELVLPKETSVSEKSIHFTDVVSHRQLNKGYGDFSDQSNAESVIDDLLFGEYVIGHFRDASQRTNESIEKGNVPRVEDALDYELEYILMGQESDKENLEAVVKKLLAIRYVPNYGYIQTDAEMKAEAEALAGTLCALLAVPAVTEAAAQMILLVWAYGESIMDIRTMLSGGKVPLVKSKTSWKLSLSGLMKLGTEEDTGETHDSKEGLKYTEYLRILFYLERREKVTLRVLDLVEQNIRKIPGKDFFRADHCISRIEIQSICHLRRRITYQFVTYYGYI